MATKKSFSKFAVAASAFRAHFTNADFGKVRVCGEENDVSGLRIPFAMEFLLDCSVLPLGVVIELLGSAGSFKTTFGYEIGRMVYDRSGWTEMFLTEGKISPHLVHSIMGYMGESEQQHPPFVAFEGETMEEWQKLLGDQITNLLKVMKEGVKVDGKKVAGAFQPVQYLVDSVMGQSLKASKLKVESEGSSGRGFAVEAKSLTDFLKAIQTRVVAGPFILTLINHLKVDKTPDFTPNVENSPGGKQIRFQASFRIKLEKVGKTRTHVVKDTENKSLFTKSAVLRLSLKKSSLGDDSNRIDIPYHMAFSPHAVTGQMVQRGQFCWNRALVALLLANVVDRKEEEAVSNKKIVRSKMDELCHFRHLRGDAFESKTFGATKASPMSADELGSRIQADESILEGLRDALGIKRYPVWDSSQDYFKFRADLRKKMQAQMTMVPE